MTQDLVSIAPSTGEKIWQGPCGDVDTEVSAACEAWPEWAAKPLTVRVETVRRFANIMRNQSDALPNLIAQETGKPLWEARSEVENVIARVNISAAAYSERTSQRKLDGAMGARTALRHKPLGVVAVITPFSSPADAAAGHIISALIAGNSIVFKPSEKAPATGELLVRCFHEAGVPPGVLRLLIGGPAVGKALAHDHRVEAVLFTGSPRNGAALHRDFAEWPHRLLALELGGNNAIVVWDTPEIAVAAALVVQSAFLTSGQNCLSARRLIAREGAHEALLAEIGKLVDRVIVGRPDDSPAPFMGPLIDNQAADTINDVFLDLMLKGGRPIKHMQRLEPALPFLRPGVIDVTNIAQRADAEYFGPLLQVIRVPNFEAAIIEANTTRLGLTASLIGGSPELYDRFWANIRAGSINWNRPTHIVAPNAPLGGTGLSGNHRPGAYYAADNVAYPVISSEAQQLRGMIGIGLGDA